MAFTWGLIDLLGRRRCTLAGPYVSAVLLAVTDDYLLELTYLEYVRYVVCDAVPAQTSLHNGLHMGSDRPPRPTPLRARWTEPAAVRAYR
jgi:hypothetical protein